MLTIWSVAYCLTKQLQANTRKGAPAPGPVNRYGAGSSSQETPQGSLSLGWPSQQVSNAQSGLSLAWPPQQQAPAHQHQSYQFQQTQYPSYQHQSSHHQVFEPWGLNQQPSTQPVPGEQYYGHSDSFQQAQEFPMTSPQIQVPSFYGYHSQPYPAVPNIGDPPGLYLPTVRFWCQLCS